MKTSAEKFEIINQTLKNLEELGFFEKDAIWGEHQFTEYVSYVGKYDSQSAYDVVRTALHFAASPEMFGTLLIHWDNGDTMTNTETVEEFIKHCDR